MMAEKRMRFVGVALVAGTISAACVSSSPNNVGPDGGSAADASLPDTASPDSGAVGDSSPDTSLPDTSFPDAAAADPFEGVWAGVQLGATIEISNAAGCSLFRGLVNGVVCDECVGTYATDGGPAAVSATCKPLAACSVSPPHTNTGTFTRVDGGLSYFYNFGGGTTTVDVQATARAPGDVCRIVDAGGGD